MSRQVSLDPDVFLALRELAETPDEPVNSVLRRVFGLDSPGADNERDAEGEFVTLFQSAVDALVRSGDLTAEPSSGVLRITQKGRRRLADPDQGGGEPEE